MANVAAVYVGPQNSLSDSQRLGAPTCMTADEAKRGCSQKAQRRTVKAKGQGGSAPAVVIILRFLAPRDRMLNKTSEPPLDPSSPSRVSQLSDQHDIFAILMPPLARWHLGRLLSPESISSIVASLFEGTKNNHASASPISDEGDAEASGLLGDGEHNIFPPDAQKYVWALSHNPG
ncbi:MAG: hypothetical protein Q9213_004518 [Squamulea squamosa]